MPENNSSKSMPTFCSAEHSGPVAQSTGSALILFPDMDTFDYDMLTDLSGLDGFGRLIFFL